jgi:hypothetical protein
MPMRRGIPMHVGPSRFEGRATSKSVKFYEFLHRTYIFERLNS